MKFFISLLVLLLHLPLMAEISLPALFSDGMILQQKIAAPVWGWAPAGTQVSVQFVGRLLMADIGSVTMD